MYIFPKAIDMYISMHIFVLTRKWKIRSIEDFAWSMQSYEYESSAAKHDLNTDNPT